MNVLVDTSVWSLVFRRRTHGPHTADAAWKDELTELIKEGRGHIIGPIRQELLSGIREERQYSELRSALRAFPDEPLRTTDYEAAARMSNQCRAVGVSGSPADFLICAVAAERGWPVFTRDDDFARYAKTVPVSLYKARSPY